MSTALLIIVGIIVVLGIWAVSVYNSLIRLRNMKDEGWSGVDVQLKRRHDLVGNLVESVKGYMTHEKSVLEEVTKSRAMVQSATGVSSVAAAEGMLTQSLGRLFAVAENYPDLKANTNMLELQQELSKLENDIQMARRYYNASARDLNIKVESFPSNIVAKKFNIAKAEYFELENTAERDVPKVSFG